MKYLKYFELARTGNQLDYDVGDIVVCVNSFYKDFQGTETILEKDKNYEVLKIYKTPEDIFLKKPFMRVDVKDLESGEITKGWESNRFKIEMEYFSDLYNM